MKCAANFVPVQAELTCEQEGTLSSTAECVLGTCSKPGLTANVFSVTPDSVRAGEKFTVKCNSGFLPESTELLCQTDGVTATVDKSPNCIEQITSKLHVVPLNNLL